MSTGSAGTAASTAASPRGGDAAPLLLADVEVMCAARCRVAIPTHPTPAPHRLSFPAFCLVVMDAAQRAMPHLPLSRRLAAFACAFLVPFMSRHSQLLHDTQLAASHGAGSAAVGGAAGSETGYNLSAGRDDAGYTTPRRRNKAGRGDQETSPGTRSFSQFDGRVSVVLYEDA